MCAVRKASRICQMKCAYTEQPCPASPSVKFCTPWGYDEHVYHMEKLETRCSGKYSIIRVWLEEKCSVCVCVCVQSFTQIRN